MKNINKFSIINTRKYCQYMSDFSISLTNNVYGVLLVIIQMWHLPSAHVYWIIFLLTIIITQILSLPSSYTYWLISMFTINLYNHSDSRKKQVFPAIQCKFSTDILNIKCNNITSGIHTTQRLSTCHSKLFFLYLSSVFYTDMQNSIFLFIIEFLKKYYPQYCFNCSTWYLLISLIFSFNLCVHHYIFGKIYSLLLSQVFIFW